MILRPLQSIADFELAASWLQREENYRWLDFGTHRERVTPVLLKIMVQRQSNFIRLFTSSEDDTPIGIVALAQVDRNMRTGVLWAVAGDKSFRFRGLTQVAAARLMTLAFQELGLHSITTWVVGHSPAVRAVARLGFRFVGRQRQCHFIGGRPCDRLLFDLLATEHRELEYEARPGLRGGVDVGATAEPAA